MSAAERPEYAVSDSKWPSTLAGYAKTLAEEERLAELDDDVTLDVLGSGEDIEGDQLADMLGILAVLFGPRNRP